MDESEKIVRSSTSGLIGLTDELADPSDVRRPADVMAVVTRESGK